MLTWYSSLPSPRVRSASSQNTANMGRPSLPWKPPGIGAGINSFSFSLTDWNCTKPLSENWKSSYIKTILTFTMWTELGLTVNSPNVSWDIYGLLVLTFQISLLTIKLLLKCEQLNVLTNSRSYSLPMNGKPAGGVMYGEFPSATVIGNSASPTSSPNGYR